MKIYVTINGNLERGNNLQFSKFFFLFHFFFYIAVAVDVISLYDLKYRAMQSIRNEGS